MRYDHEYIFAALDERFFDKGLLVNNLRKEIYDQIDIGWRNENAGNGKSWLECAMTSENFSATEYAFAAFEEMAIESAKWLYDKNPYCSRKMLAEYLKRYGYEIKDVLAPVIAAVEKMRKEY